MCILDSLPDNPYFILKCVIRNSTTAHTLGGVFQSTIWRQRQRSHVSAVGALCLSVLPFRVSDKPPTTLVPCTHQRKLVNALEPMLILTVFCIQEHSHQTAVHRIIMVSLFLSDHRNELS